MRVNSFALITITAQLYSTHENAQKKRRKLTIKVKFKTKANKDQLLHKCYIFVVNNYTLKNDFAL